MGKAYDALKTRLGEIQSIGMAGAVLGWDQRVFMPPKGAEARARQSSILAKIGHDLFIGNETRDLLAAAEAEQSEFPDDSDERAMLRVARRDFDKATKVPTSLIVEMTEVSTLAEEIWTKARPDNDYPTFAPWLDRILGLKRQYAHAIGFQKRMYDALLDDFEEGMTADLLDPLFESLKAATIPLVASIVARAGRVDDDFLGQECDERHQEEFARRVLAECGYDFTRGRLDRAAHPFCTNFSINDVRITTRYNRTWMTESLFGCLHEMGHALYEMNCNPAFDGTILAGGVSLGVHESQSRLWENLVGRSRPFWEHYYPELQRVFAQQFRRIELEAFYRAINRVTPSLIRTEADEVTYNLHIILRYEMENELLEDKLRVADAPAAWNAKMKGYLGVVPPNDTDGILQDIHWSGGGIGYFPTYTLGNILAVQWMQKARETLPTLDAQLRAGHFAGLFDWLRTNIHQHGRKYPPGELVRRVTGRPLTIEPYLQYLRTKFGAIYGV